MIGKVSKTLQNYCKACGLQKYLGKIHKNYNQSIIVDVLDQNSPSTFVQQK